MAKKSSKAKKIAKQAKKYPKIAAAIAVLLVIIIVAAVVLYFVKPDLYHKFLGVGDHTWSEWEITEADCGNDGERSRRCEICDESESEVIPATGKHVWGEWEITDADCGNDGERARGCTVCGEAENEVLPATGEHIWGDWVVIKDSDCGNSGARIRACEVCEEVENQVLYATGEHNFGADGVCTVCGYDPDSGVGVFEETKTAELSIHFLELGNKYTGDCTLIKYGDVEILIDAGSRKNSAATIKNYVDEYCTDGVLEYVIATHAHQDHIAGFVGNASGSSRTGILYSYEIGTLIQFAGHNTNSQIYKDYCTAVEYARSRGTKVFTALECWNNAGGGAQRTYYLDSENTLSMNILYNYYYDHETGDENDYSVCMLLTQDMGDATYNYLFTGDLEERGESYLVDYNALPEVDLFKGGHHGSYTASTEKLLSVIKPKNVAVCCCCGTPEYGASAGHEFPAQEFIDRVSKYTENVYCTTLIVDYRQNEFLSMNGNIVFYTKGGRLKLYCSNNDTKLKDTDWFRENRQWNRL